MSDHGAAPDPVDKAYVQSEALLSDDAARAARRARVLAAVAREPATPQSHAAPPKRRSPWRPGGWLAAACVAGFCVFLTARVYQPARDQAPPSSTSPAVPSPVTRASAAPEPEARTLTSARPTRPHRSEPAPDAYPAAPAPAPAPAPAAPMAAPPPPPLSVPPPSGTEQVVVTGSRIAGRAFAAQSRALTMQLNPTPSAASAPDLAVRLRTAAARGRTAELEALLAQGVPVDAPDANGTTALMKSVQADQPAAAALLRRNGASLDQRDRSGLSAREMAIGQDDPELRRAIGVSVDGDTAPGPRIGSQ